MKKIKILIVEDEAIIAKYLSLELEYDGFNVCAYVGSAEEAIATAAKEQPDLILMDINLNGEMDGIEAMEKIGPDIPVIFMTGYSQKDIVERAKNLKPLGFFPKPVEVEYIKPVIEAYFKTQK